MITIYVVHGIQHITGQVAADSAPGYKIQYLLRMVLDGMLKSVKYYHVLYTYDDG